ncbi:MAG: tetratricopeptide repeat protein [Verrucomicrobia bacterium]|nr:tetratricopeptide repeat protein [Verrucomicrobiota bacterium]
MPFQASDPSGPDPFAEAERLLGAGRIEEAKFKLHRLTQHPEHGAAACLRLGQIYRRERQALESIEWFQQAAKAQPDWAEAHHELALALLDCQRAQEAVASLQQALALDKAHAGARRTLANLLQAAGHWREAAQEYAELLPVQPNDPTLFQQFGLCCQELGEFQLAEKAYLKTLHFGLDSPELQFNLGATRLKLGRPLEAISTFQKALLQDPLLTLANLGMANAYRQLGDLDSAEACLRRELEINPNCADAAVNLGVLLHERHRVGEAIGCYKKAISLNPHHPILRWNFAIASLLAGDFKTGWNEYEWRWQVKHKPKPKFPQPEWDGSDLNGRALLLYAEQGFGDTLMFARYAPLVARRGGRVVMQCQPPLKRLLAAMPDLQVVAEGEPLPPCDVQAPLMSLPRIFGAALDAEHRWEPYLRVPPETDWKLPAHDATKIKVGLAWASNPHHPVSSQKSVALARWEPVLSVPHCEFFSLQIDPDPSATAVMQSRPNLHGLPARFGDFADTAAAISQLDLVISVDTAVAHLAGGLGHLVWVLLSFSADWRWLLKRRDSPWYPTMSLFRQPQPGNWDAAISEVATHLTELSARMAHERR